VSTRWFAPCPKGLEYLLVDELRALGASEAREALAGVHFEGDATLGYRVCLGSRLASRVLLPLAEFEAETADQLAAGVATIDWSEHLDADGTLAIDAHGSTRGLTNAAYAAQRTKDAIVDQFRARTGMRPSVSNERPSVRLNLALRHGRAHLSLDFAGGALFMRGYRRGQGEAPLKENLAAAILLRGRWPEVYARGGALFDPMCGAGTLLIEAAWMAADVAPGLKRDWFGFFAWKQFDRATWDALHAEATERAQRGLAALRPVFFGADQNAAVLGAAKQNAQAAGVAGFMRLLHTSIAKLDAPETETAGLVVANPPYGERLGERETLRTTYAEIGSTLKRAFAGWTAAIITSDEELGRAIGLKPERRYKLWNGPLECVLLCYDSITPGELVPREQRALSEAATALKNRLVKNLRVLKPRLAREGVTCYRAYDADLPEYAAAIDVYTGRHTSAIWLHVQEYAPPPEIPEAKAQRHLDDLVRVAQLVFDVPRERVALKTRRPQQRREKYQRVAQRGEFVEVEEAGAVLLVNLFDYLDTGLFLDHRPTRARLRGLARGKSFLNLFCYTGAATVHAIAGGAAATTSIDLSHTYLDWAERNLEANGYGGVRHRLEQSDVLAWLEAGSERYDLVFVDPPTFSNSKRADDFDVQRDHVRLLELCGDRLAPGGLIVFSNNFRRFKLDREALERAGFSIRELGRASIPFDFARNPRIHQTFELARV